MYVSRSACEYINTSPELMFIKLLIYGSTIEYDIKVRIPTSRFGFTHQDPYTCMSIFLKSDCDSLV